MVGPGQPAPGCLDLGRPRHRPRRPGRHAGPVWSSPLSLGHRPAVRRGPSRPIDLTGSPRCRPLRAHVRTLRRAGIAAALAAAPLGLAYRFALAYRVRAGYPRRSPPRITPADIGLPYESMLIESDGLPLPAWFIPARGRRTRAGRRPGPRLGVGPRPDAADGRLPPRRGLPLPDLRRPRQRRQPGRGRCRSAPASSGPTRWPAFRALIEQPEVTRRRDLRPLDGRHRGDPGGCGGPARGGASSRRPAPADPYRLTRQTFRLARLPIPDPIAYPLAWLTTRVYVRPRGHVVDDISATTAIARYDGPVLLIHGADDTVVPAGHLDRLAAAARAARAGDPFAAERRDAPRRRRPALVAVRGRRLPAGRGRLPDPGDGRSAGAGGGGRPRRGDATRRGSPTARPRSRPSRTRSAGSGRSPRSPCPGATRAPRPEPSRRVQHDRAPRAPSHDRIRVGTDPVWRAIATKRVVRRFADRPLEPAHLERILDAGRRSGSSKNMQRWTFIVCRDRDHLRELSAVGPWAGHLAGAAVGDRPADA